MSIIFTELYQYQSFISIILNDISIYQLNMFISNNSFNTKFSIRFPLATLCSGPAPPQSAQ